MYKPPGCLPYFFPFGPTVYGILVPRPGTEPMHHEFKLQCLNHWAARKVPRMPAFLLSNYPAPLPLLWFPFSSCLSHRILSCLWSGPLLQALPRLTFVPLAAGKVLLTDCQDIPQCRCIRTDLRWAWVGYHFVILRQKTKCEQGRGKTMQRVHTT